MVEGLLGKTAAKESADPTGVSSQIMTLTARSTFRYFRHRDVHAVAMMTLLVQVVTFVGILHTFLLLRVRLQREVVLLPVN
jgi:hypothetical protein